jgi:hypothetical protein
MRTCQRIFKSHYKYPNGIKENDATPIALNATREFKMTLQNFTTLHSFQLLVWKDPPKSYNNEKVFGS